MGGLGQQAQRKGEKRASAMSPAAEELKAAEMWRKPPDAHCDDVVHTTDLGQCSRRDVQLKLREKRESATWFLVEFALILQVQHDGEWKDVASVDTSHADECHIHQIGRTMGDRIGDPEVLMAITCMDDVQQAYTVAYGHLEAHWQAHVERWRNG